MEILCRGRRFSLARARAHVGDRSFERDLLLHPGASVVIAFPSPGRLVMVRQFRPGPGGWVLELPAGTIKEGEDPAETARRELKEETGYEAVEVVHVFSFYSSPGLSTEVMHVFLARGLRRSQASPEDDEAIEVVEVELEKAVEMIRRGEIVDGKTIASLLYCVHFVDGCGAEERSQKGPR